MKYYLIAGEASGDLHGANLMKTIKTLDPEASFRFWGGDLMLAQGGTLVNHYKERAFMGISEVIKNLGKILGFIKQCKKDLMANKPDALILVDYPGFNMKIAKFARQHGIVVHYYISPKVWAWNTSRVHKIKRDINYLYSILPFEVDFYKQYGMKIDYVGNPICDAIQQFNFNPDFKEANGFTKPVIALLPGSRLAELRYVLPSMLSVVDKFKDYEFILAGTHAIDDEVYQSYLKEIPVRVIKNQTYDVIKNAHAALVCSGTATLETALLNCPQVVCYRFSNLSYQIGKLVIKIKFISLVNLIMNKKVVTELIQNELSTDNIINELNVILEGDGRKNMTLSYVALKNKVGGPGASERTAELIVRRTKQ
ncbi:MAG: lipid-A-disaccharide synthase [Bacteroidota bacterium]